MTHISNRISRLAVALAVAAFVVPVGPALAGEGNGPSFPGLNAPDVVIGGQTLGTSLSRAARDGAGSSGIAIGTTLPSNTGSQGEPEPVNSLPPGFENGTPALLQLQAVQQYWARHPTRG